MKDLSDIVDNLAPAFVRLEQKKAKLNSSRPLPLIVLDRLREDLSIEWTYNSNSIEGNTLSLNETRVVLQDGVTIGGKSLREHFETINHAGAIEHLYQLAKPKHILKGADILSLHAMVMKNIDDDFAGRYRNAAVRIVGANFVPPNASKVASLMDELLHQVHKNPDGLNDVVLASFFHHRFAWIHPFFDGNGRTIRLAMNLLLMVKGYPPAIILKNDRKKYYDALNQANLGNYYKLTLLISQAMERTLNIYLNAMPGNYDEYEPINNIAEDPSVPYGQEYISLLARRGKIDAYKEGRTWFTSKKAVKNYLKKVEKNK